MEHFTGKWMSAPRSAGKQHVGQVAWIHQYRYPDPDPDPDPDPTPYLQRQRST